jgi:hypothetical protein
VPKDERVRRAKVLRELSFERLKNLHEQALEQLKHSGRPLQSILLEGGVKAPDGQIRWIAGYTPNYLRVLLPLKREDGSVRTVEGLSNQIVDALPGELVLDRDSGDIAILGRWL